MSAEKAFWNAALTVGTAYVISTGLVLYLVHPQVEWPGVFFIVPAVMALPALVLFTVMYSRYREGPRPQPSPRQLIVIGSIWALFGMFCIIRAFFDREQGWNSISTWFFVGGSVAIASHSFYRARRQSEDRPEIQ